MVPAWCQTVILVPARTFALKFDDIYPPRSMDSKQLCTRAEVDGGANKGLPQTPPPLKSVTLWWSLRDEGQCTDRKGT